MRKNPGLIMVYVSTQSFEQKRAELLRRLALLKDLEKQMIDLETQALRLRVDVQAVLDRQQQMHILSTISQHN